MNALDYMKRRAQERLLAACYEAPADAVWECLADFLDDGMDKPASDFDARVWLAELAWCDGETPDAAESVSRELEASK